MIIKYCSKCSKSLKFIRKWKFCANLGCIEYKKKLRRYDVRKQSEKEKNKIQEEE